MGRKLPGIGIQTFEKLIKEDCLYIDKTEFVYSMTHGKSNYMFLSRPRRFGKSLLVSTLKSYFEGRRELFKGLAMEHLEKEWTVHPVLHFDMSTAKHAGEKDLILELERKLFQYEKIYGREEADINPNQRLEGLIKRACEQTGRQVVVLIDEYDAPLLDVMHEDENLPNLRNIMRNFYSPLKACDPYLRFVFLTGITEFSQLSIFSELNNILNISMLPQYAAICGITQEELETRMRTEVEYLAGQLGVTYCETMERLKSHYDGYHFSKLSPDIYNPFSLLNALSTNDIASHWFGSGTPTYLVEMLRKFNVQPSDIGGYDADAADFDAPTERMTSIVPLLYQSGYITIKGYDNILGLYTLDIPNKEVRIGLMRSLLPNYLHEYTSRGNTTIAKMYGFMLKDDIDGALQLMKTFLGTVPYTSNTDYEGHWQQMMYVIFSLLGAYVDVEVHTRNGRVDMVLRTANKLYIFELKLNKSAETAMQQITLKSYDERSALTGLPVVRVGINFSSETKNIEDWVIE